MFLTRALPLCLAAAAIALCAPASRATVGIQPIPSQTIPSGKTLVVPVPATDPSGPQRTYTVTISPPTVTSGSTTVSATAAGIVATVRTGDPHFVMGVSYSATSGSSTVTQSGTMEFQMLRELAPITTNYISGLAQAGFYSPVTTGTTTKYITFHRVISNLVIQGGDPKGDGSGGPGFSFEEEFNPALIFSATAGQLAMANSGSGLVGPATVRTPQFTAIHAFGTLLGGDNSDGAVPVAALVTGSEGYLYGLASAGGQNGAGVLFQATPSGTVTPVHAFAALVGGTNADGAKPDSLLATPVANSFAGTAQTGGRFGQGTFFTATSGGSFSLLHSFSGGIDGGTPSGPLATDGNGNFYGAAATGGTAGSGVIYQVTSGGAFSVIYTFSPLSGGINADGAAPYGGLVGGMDGNYYGVTSGGGANGTGTVFRVTPAGVLDTIYSFGPLAGGTNGDGANPRGGLVQSAGVLYGVAAAGGTNGAGTIFQIQTSGALFMVMHTFAPLAGGTNAEGAAPLAGMIIGGDGTLYGTASAGGTAGAGVIFQETGGNAFTLMHSFSPATDGSGPQAALVQAGDGFYYGVTPSGGARGNGTIFKFSPTSIAPPVAGNGSNGSQFFVTQGPAPRSQWDFKYNIFGQLLRGDDTLNGIASTPVQPNGSGEESSPVNPVNITSCAVTHNDTDAVLLLSATGVCDAVVTVTVTSGSATASGTFAAHAVADTIEDAPFLRPVPDIAAPNGSVKVPLKAVDLQLTQSIYGFQRFLPVYDGNLVGTSTSPVITVPVVSNTDNAVIAAVDQVHGSTRGFDARPFHIGAGDRALAGALATLPAGTSGTLATPAIIATFTAAGPRTTGSGYSADVNYGDGTYLSGTQVKIAAARGTNKFEVVAGHIYTKPGQYPLVVHIQDIDGPRLTLTGTTNVSASSFAIAGLDISSSSAALVNQPVAIVLGTSSPATAYAATINWGDGAFSPGIVAANRKKLIQVLGTHTYHAPGAYTVSVAVTRGTAGLASEWSTAAISGSAGTVLPPFAQAHLNQLWLSGPTLTPQPVFSSGTGAFNVVGGLVAGTGGLLYGAAAHGGANTNDGAIFSITDGTSGNVFTRVASFANYNGSQPFAGLVSGTGGLFYGTTVYGGDAGTGVVYQVSTGGTVGAISVLHSFSATAGASGTNADGAYPHARLLVGSDGTLYGDTIQGGRAGTGSIYQITLGGTAGPRFQPLYSFTATGSNNANTDGANPYYELNTGTDGLLYGTAVIGGTGGTGTIFSLRLTGSSPNVSGSLTVLHAFSPAGGSGTNPDGAFPYGGLASGTDGSFYGVATAGGTNGWGAIYKVATSGSFQVLYTFSTVASGTINVDGALPETTLTAGTDGDFYGSTFAGGTAGVGTLFRITPGGVFTPLFSFDGGTNGAHPLGQLVLAGDGDFYGTTQSGGVNGGGTIYRLTPGGMVTVIASLTAAGRQTGYQYALSAVIEIVNSGNVPSQSGTFSVRMSASNVFDPGGPIFSGTGGSSFPVPPLAPGAATRLVFAQQGGVTDNRPRLPAGTVVSGQYIFGDLEYKDPVGDYDGGQIDRQYSPAHF